MTDSFHLVSEWPLRPGEIVRVSLDRFNGRRVVVIAIWSAKGKLLEPTSRNFSLGIEHLPELADAMNEALQRAQRDADR